MMKNGKSKPLIEFSTKREEYFIKVIISKPPQMVLIFYEITHNDLPSL